MLKIAIHNNRIAGGPANFIKRLVGSFDKYNLAKAVGALNLFQDIGLCCSVASKFYLKPYVVRIDGIYYDKKNTSGSNEKLNKNIYKTIRKAKGVIFQTEYAKSLVEAHYGSLNIPNAVIMNGAPLKEIVHKKNKKKIIVCSANWRIHKRLKSIIDVVEELNKKIDCELLVIGDTRNVQTPAYDFTTYTGEIDAKNISNYLKDADLFIHLGWLDVCPNSVIEAIASGVPVVCSNQGGTPEIIEKTKFGRVAICDVKVNYEGLVDLYNPPDPNIKKIVKEAEYIFNNYESLISSSDRSFIDIRNIAKKYIHFISNLTN